MRVFASAALTHSAATPSGVGDTRASKSLTAAKTSSSADSTRDHAVTYSDEKVANRDTKVWHFVIEIGY